MASFIQFWAISSKRALDHSSLARCAISRHSAALRSYSPGVDTARPTLATVAGTIPCSPARPVNQREWGTQQRLRRYRSLAFSFMCSASQTEAALQTSFQDGGRLPNNGAAYVGIAPPLSSERSRIDSRRESIEIFGFRRCRSIRQSVQKGQFLGARPAIHRRKMHGVSCRACSHTRECATGSRRPTSAG
jgi:hypothetical protein